MKKSLITINIQKTHFYILTTLILIFTAAGFTYALNTNPAVFGHIDNGPIHIVGDNVEIAGALNAEELYEEGVQVKRKLELATCLAANEGNSGRVLAITVNEPLGTIVDDCETLCTNTGKTCYAAFYGAGNLRSFEYTETFPISEGLALWQPCTYDYSTSRTCCCN